MHFVETRPWTLNARLRLFIQICDAVQYAHQNLVVHRDLKPSNILVQEPEGAGKGDPRVMLLDFGIARLLEETNGAETDVSPLTRVMTPEYAAPEQIRGGDLSTSADVYGLGVVLYELLAGSRPYNLEGLSPAELETVVCDEDPPAPSRVAVPPDVRRSLEGDLDTIVMKAIAKEPERRYPSAEALAGDITRFLSGRPVRARPATPMYRVAKFIRRNRIAVATGVAMLVLLTAGVAGIFWQARTAARERDRAQTASAHAEESLALLVDLFEEADPGTTDGELLSARDVLDRAASRVGLVDAGATVRATLLDALAGVYHNLGSYDRAVTLRSDAAAIMDSEPATPDNLAALGTYLSRMSQSYFRMSQLARADSVAAAAVDALRAAGDAHTLALASALQNRAATLRENGGLEEAGRVANESLMIQRGILPDNDPAIASSLYLIAATRHDAGDYAGAEPLFRDALAVFARSADSVSVEAADAAATLGQFLTFKGEFDEAELLLRKSLDIRRTLYGELHPMVIANASQLGIVLYQRGDAAGAEPHLRSAIAAGESVMGPDQYDVLSAKQALAAALFELGELDEAATLFEEVARGYRAVFGGDHGVIVSTLAFLGNTQLELGRLEPAEAAFEESEAMARRVFSDTHPYIATALQGRAAIAARRGATADAESMYRDALEITSGALRDGHHLIATAQKDLGRFLLRTGRPADAVPLLEHAAASYAAQFDETNASLLNAQSLLGAALRETGDSALASRANSLLHHAAATLELRYGPEHRFTVQARERIR